MAKVRLVTGSAAYHTARWAVGGFTEALAQEVASFGVKVCALEPGGMLTTGALVRTETPLTCPRSMNRPSARSPRR
jgi:NAD(P)-dependent dehydrogenase (short-subunit alcohol dehydrogenase family)